jgi:hypothetical protein
LRIITHFQPQSPCTINIYPSMSFAVPQQHRKLIVTQSSTDLPLLVNVRNLATRLLTAILPDSTPASPSTALPSQQANPSFRIGFITPPFKDNKIPVTDHLHAHAYIAPADLLGWWRGIAYGALAWYAVDDLIAEIRFVPFVLSAVKLRLIYKLVRETVSNNRVKSGYQNRTRAPIDLVPSAGARSGTAAGIETSQPGLAPQLESLEEGQPSPLSLSRTSSFLEPQSQIPQLSV